jgi:flagellar hook-basal body complex protein FliE
MEIRSTLASQFYTRALDAARPADDAGGRDPAQAIGTAARDFMAVMRESEATVQAGLVGEADAQSVVEALAATELAVQTAVAVRDRVVEAYQEILRMPV